MSSDNPSSGTAIIGVGNAIRSDDGVGLHVVRMLGPKLADRPGIELIELPWGGLRLMEQLIGYARAIVIDALVGPYDAGTLHWLTPDGLPTYHSGSSHDVDFATALEVGRSSGAVLPPDHSIHLLGIGVSDVQSYSQDLTPEVSRSVPIAAQAVLTRLEDLA